jgi:hypothetical protein
MSMSDPLDAPLATPATVPAVEGLIYALPEGVRPDAFWNAVKLPHQTEDPTVDFVNAVVAAEWFAAATATIAEVGGLSEMLEEEIANLKVHKRRAEDDLAVFVRRIKAKHYKAMTKTADRSVQETFVYAMAVDDGTVGVLEELEGRVKDLVKRIEVRTPRLAQFHERMEKLKLAMESTRQYLDYQKLEMRVNSGNNGGQRGAF